MKNPSIFWGELAKKTINDTSSSTVFSAEVVEYDLIFCFLLLCHFTSLSVQTMLTAISMSAIATNGVVPGG